jgi:hypothetical protein
MIDLIIAGIVIAGCGGLALFLAWVLKEIE